MEIISDPTPGAVAISWFDDGVIDMQEPLRRLT